MKLNTEQNPFGNINTLASKAVKLGLIRDVEATAYKKMGVHDPELMYKQLSLRFHKLSFDEMWKNDVLTILKTGHPSLYQFLSRVHLTVRGSSKNIKNRAWVLSDTDLMKLVRSALSDKLIDEKQSQMYFDAICHTDLQSTLDNMEFDILIKVDGFDYEKFKSEAPAVLKYIETHFTVWYKNLIQSFTDKFK